MKMERRALLCAWPTLVAAGLAACTSPPARYYRLAAVPGPTCSDGPPTIGVRSISIPGYLDQNGIAKPSGDYQFDSYSNELWAEPLADMLQATMVQDLVQRLPESTVTGSGGGIGVPSDVLVEINVSRFDPDPAGRIVLTMQIAIQSGGSRTLWMVRTFDNSSAPAGNDGSQITAAMSTLWAAAADEIGSLVVESWVDHPEDSPDAQ
jgi:uncharacterized lipoprotein YmbA